MRTAGPARTRTRRSGISEAELSALLRQPSFFIFFFVTRVAAAFVVAFGSSAAAFGVIFLSAI